MLFAVLGPDTPDVVAILERNKLGATGIHFAEHGSLRVSLLNECAVLVRMPHPCLRERHLAVELEFGDQGRGQSQLEHPRVEVLQVDLIGFVIFCGQSINVGLEPKINILGDQDGRAGFLFGLNAQGLGEDPIVHAASSHHIQCGSSLGRR